MMRFRKTLLAAVFAFALAFGQGTPAGAIEVKRVISPGGIEAWLVEDHINPILNIRFAFRGGAALDPVGKEGLATMVASLVDEGAGDLPSKAFQQELEDLAITLRFSADQDTLGGQLRTLTENQDRALELLRLALTKPRFDAEPVERIRAQVLASLRAEEESPNAIAGKELSKVLFPGHPYGRPSTGTKEGVAAVTEADLRGFVKNRLGQDNLIIGVVGDITPEQLKPILDRTFGALPKTAQAWKVPEVAPLSAPRTIVIERDVPQSAIVFADKGVKRSDPDFYAAYVMNHILGGGSFTSRLYQEVREKRGLAYGVFSSLHPLDHSALYLGGAGTANERAAETIQVVRDEWRRMATHGATKEELDAAKTFILGSYVLRLTDSQRIAAILVNLQLDNLGISYVEDRNTYIGKVTQADIKRVSKKLLDADGLTFVVVGQPQGVETTN